MNVAAYARVSTDKQDLGGPVWRDSTVRRPARVAAGNYRLRCGFEGAGSPSWLQAPPGGPHAYLLRLVTNRPIERAVSITVRLDV